MFMISKGLGVDKATHDLLKSSSLSATEKIMQIDAEEFMQAPEVNRLQFAGICAVSCGSKPLEHMKLGIGWHAAMIDELFSNPITGSTHP
jgi:hypothetical protein